MKSMDIKPEPDDLKQYKPWSYKDLFLFNVATDSSPFTTLIKIFKLALI